MAGQYPKRLLINRVNVQRISGSTVDSRGLKSTQWSNLSTDNPCRLNLVGESENRDGRNTITQSWVAYLSGDVDIKASDRLYEPSTGKYFEIDSVAVSKNRVGRTFMKRLSLLYFE